MNYEEFKSKPNKLKLRALGEQKPILLLLKVKGKQIYLRAQGESEASQNY